MDASGRDAPSGAGQDANGAANRDTPRRSGVGTVRGRGDEPWLRVTGRQWEAMVLDLARTLGWRVAHFRAARTSSGGWATPVAGDGAGFPDLVLARGDRLVFAELKAGSGRTSAAQRAWLDALASTGAEAYVWRPAAWDEIVATLR